MISADFQPLFLFKLIIPLSPFVRIFAEKFKNYAKEILKIYRQEIQVLALPSAPKETVSAF